MTKVSTPPKSPTKARVAWALAELERAGSKASVAQMRTRFGIVTKWKVFGAPVGHMQKLAKQLGRDHKLALALWKTGVYDGQMLATMVADPAEVTPALMEAWAEDFDNWGTVDTACFKLFDQTPYVFTKGAKWAKAKDEYVKRAGFVLIACGALHGAGTDADYLKLMPLLREGAKDERNFVKKGVSWALRAIGGKKSPKLRAAARALANELAASGDAAQRWVGKDALRAFAKAKA